jgi:hypothetical protein
MNEWLVRTAQNQITGPFSKDVVCKMIQEGKLGIEDEVCPANGYWIYLYEREEVKRQLGIEAPKAPLVRSDEEVTETETATEMPTESQELVSPYSKIDESAIEQIGEQTGVLTTRAMRAASAVKAVPPKTIPKVDVVGVTARPAGAKAKTGLFSLSTLKRWGWLIIVAAASAAVCWLRYVRTE